MSEVSIATFTPQALQEFKERVARMNVQMREKYVMKALRAGGKVVHKRAVSPGVVPVLWEDEYRKGRMYRKRGTLRDHIAMRRSRDDEREGNLGVFINVRPARGGLRGKDSPVDPFYWRFVHFGTKYMRARPFLTIAARELPGAALQEIVKSLGGDMRQLEML